MIQVIRIIHQHLQFFSCCCIYKERRNKTTKTGSKTNTQPSTEYSSVRMRFKLILCFAYMSIHDESKSTTSSVLLSMSRMSSTSFEYEWCE